MAAEVKKEIELEIAHVLFIDIVAYSKMAIDDQRAAIEKLNQIVRSTEQFGKAERENRLLKIAIGDGMALVFYQSPEDPVECALEISRAIQEQRARLRLRMGIHSGPVSGVVDVTGRANVAGAGINLAQRVMNCADAGHILVSKRVAEDLAQFKHWRPHLYNLGECEVKHGEKMEIVNLYTAELGNRERPQHLTKLVEKVDVAPISTERQKSRKSLLVMAACAAIAALTVGIFLFWTQQRPKTSALGSAVPEKSIAVLPFENLSKDEENAFFAGGMQDEILSDLAKIADLKVISRTSVMKYKSGPERNLREIAKVLGVANIVEGSVQRAAGRVRVSAQLIDARSDTHLWADHYDRELADVFTIQTEIAQQIARELRAKLSPQEKAALANRPTQDTEAYDLYLRAKELMHSTSLPDPASVEMLSNSVKLLEKAVARDPNFALAYCLLAEANLSLYWRYESVAGARERAEAALQAARRLAPEAGETYLAEALFFYWGKRDYDHALESLEKAARLSPNSVDVFRFSSWVERRLGRWTEAIRHQLRAAELDPRDWNLRDEATVTYILLRDYTEAERLADRAVADWPEKADQFRALKAEAAFGSGDLKSARASLDALSAPEADFIWQLWTTAMLERNYDEARRVLNIWAKRNEPGDILSPRILGEALTARATGQTEKVRAGFLATRQHYVEILRDRNEQPRLVSQLAIVDAGLGQKEEALKEAHRAVELLPISRDALYGPEMKRNLALVYSWVGEPDHAIEQLWSIATLPGGPSYGELKFDPVWDELRGDPRFEKIVASLAPKEK